MDSTSTCLRSRIRVNVLRTWSETVTSARTQLTCSHVIHQPTLTGVCSRGNRRQKVPHQLVRGIVVAGWPAKFQNGTTDKGEFEIKNYWLQQVGKLVENYPAIIPGASEFSWTSEQTTFWIGLRVVTTLATTGSWIQSNWLCFRMLVLWNVRRSVAADRWHTELSPIDARQTQA